MNNGLENGDGEEDEFDIDLDATTTYSSSQLPLFGNGTLSSNTITHTATNGIISNGSNTISIGQGNSGLGGVYSGGVYGTGTGGYGVVGTGGNGNYIWQQSPNTVTIGGTGFAAGSGTQTANDKYAVFKLPHTKIPEAVYVAGRMVTLGLMGSDVECAFMGDMLVFSPHVLSNMQFNNRITIILQYANVMYHYKVHHNFGLIEMMPESNIVKTTLLSEIKRGDNV